MARGVQSADAGPAADGPPRDFDALRAALVAREGALSRRLTQVARFFLNHPEEAAVSTLVALARNAGVPPATITRFAKELGFAGFAELQAVFRERLLGPRAPYADRVVALRGAGAPERLDDAELDAPDRVFARLVAAATRSLFRIEDELDRAALARFVDALAEAEVVHVAAARGAFGVGAYTVYGLASVGKRAHLVDNLGAMRLEQAAAIGPRDALLAVTFDDYTPETVEVARHAAARGRTVLAITDNALSPVQAVAGQVLYVNEARLGHFRSQVPAMVLCQTLIASLGRRLGAGMEQGFQIDENEKIVAERPRARKDVPGEEP